METLFLNTTNQNFYDFSNTDEFLNYLPVIDKMIEDFRFTPAEPRIYTGLKVGYGPNGIAINPRTNMVYIANTRSHLKFRLRLGEDSCQIYQVSDS